MYNTHDEVDALADGIRQAQKFFGSGVMELESMYQEIILEHYRRPLHAGLREPLTPRYSTSTRPAATR